MNILPERLKALHERTPGRVAITLQFADRDDLPITCDRLLRGSAAFASTLVREEIQPGEVVVLILQHGEELLYAFWGSILHGAIPSIMPFLTEKLSPERYRADLASLISVTQPAAIVTYPEFEADVRAALKKGDSVRAVILTSQIEVENGLNFQKLRGFERGPQDIVLLQHSSGTTGLQKGVALSHQAVFHQLDAYGNSLSLNEEDVIVSWLPLYHDMGLIGMWLGALYFGVPAALMSPLAFLSRPSRWLWSIHMHRATISAAPNFAYGLCARKVTDDELAGLDLSSWRVAVNGSEAVSPETIEHFTRRFAPYGFKAQAMCPAYGLAEASVALTVGALRRPPLVDRVAREPFERAREVRPASADERRALRFVSCGRPLRDHDVQIADQSGQALGERRDGRIRFRGPSVTHGYFRNAAATRAAMHDGWMDSGDLGYHVGGELFITGREKDLIIQSGRNVCAEEVEALASTVPGIRPGCVAAFGIHDPVAGTERLVVVAEMRARDRRLREPLQRAVRDRLVDGIGSPPDIVVIADPGSVLKTPSGKIRRAATRDACLAGILGAHQSIARQRVRLQADALRAWAGNAARVFVDAVFTAWVLSVLLVTLPVLWGYLAVSIPGPHAHRAARRWCRFALTACGVRPHVDGLDRPELPDAGIFVANHASYLDVVVLMAVIPVAFRFVAKRALTSYPLIGTVIRKAGYLTIEKAGFSDRLAGAEEVGRRLREGERLMIFPEGTFVRAPGLLPFRLGAFRAAVDAGRPIVPIAIAGTRHVLPDGRWLLRRGPITVTIGAPLTPQARGWPEMVRLRDSAVAIIKQRCGEETWSGNLTGEK